MNSRRDATVSLLFFRDRKSSLHRLVFVDGNRMRSYYYACVDSGIIDIMHNV